jgi:CheY-like chemotaxis protein
MENKKKVYFAETPFDQLMQKRIHKVLLVSSAYDAFLMEDDGRIDEQIFNEYVALNLRYPPQFVKATSEKEAFEFLESDKDIDLIITMLNTEGRGPFALARKFKARKNDLPVVVLTAFSREISLKFRNEDLSTIDYVFSWLGNSDLLLAIIKLIEDQMNADYDIHKAGVQTILLVENSKRFYSAYLPIIYKIIFQQSKAFMSEGLNEHQKMLRMRGRPKIMLATNYEEAWDYYTTYKSNLLGVISDVSYYREGKKDKQAGMRLAKHIKEDDPYMPVLLQSAEIENRKTAKEIKVGFLHKQSPTLNHDLKNFIKEYFAFGDFVFINPDTGEALMRVSNLKELQKKIYDIPDFSLRYHLKRNHLSKWLNARALFPVAEFLRYLSLDDFKNLQHARKFIHETITNFRLSKGRGVIAKFYRDKFDESLNFARIGDGSIGGKARGLAFLDSLVKRNWILDKYNNIILTIPRTVVIATDIFDEFMEQNELYELALSDNSDEEILDAFVNAELPQRVHEDLDAFLSVVDGPVAVRSSSLLEDSHYEPFAGVYTTYMIPNPKDNDLVSNMLRVAIKSVYASVYYKDSKAYMQTTSNVIDEEKMAVVLQEVCGHEHEERYYPTFSGVARSINFYPIEPEKSKDGIANIAFGLGKYIVDGGISLRFSPKYPKKILQLSSAKSALTQTQKYFYALDLSPEKFEACVKDDINILKLRIKDAEGDYSFKSVVSTYDYQNDILRDGGLYEGKKLVTFANILKYNSFPLADILHEILTIGHNEMNNPIEIEFAVNITPDKDAFNIFNLLQIRPIVENNETISEDLSLIKPEEAIIICKQALGNGIIDDIRDVIYVKPEGFNAKNNRTVAEIIGKLNEQFLNENKNYILTGPGRWGSSDPWLGIPVKWAQISAARLIVEAGLENYRIDPSQGTHFFQNLTSYRVGYFTINPYINDGFLDTEFLNSFEAEYEDDHIRHVRFSSPAVIKISGKKSRGVVMKPMSTDQD